VRRSVLGSEAIALAEEIADTEAIMPIHEYTVWILGAGFSKSLGGPLLVDLFRQQARGDLEKVLGRPLATEVTWVQALFNYGKDIEHLWGDAEEFLAYTEAAHGTVSPNAQKAALLWGVMCRGKDMLGPQ
jgi:hypothetical protein